ncbi:ABC transporter substrate-binding protein [Odoribacter sp. OttesenSCG-928-J03]|nr:ABC transporter substrate-binding protein [Odoribacter sp. OttesenSCG-928-J03]MDL2283129.1 ABC transporter substrate-binding protein [Odoribacter sp. OttesenSCG-928-G04]MDL2330485.1 ABC transporter substrate-binding protein [Odoribacter sp. OttesenSCG-928-A06]
MTKYLVALFFIVALLSLSCRQKSNSSIGGETEEYTVKYAAGFTVKRCDGYTEVFVRDPWDTTKCLQHYVLVNRERPLPEKLPTATLVRVPLQRMIVSSSVHCAILEMLGEAENIVGVCESRYIGLDFIQNKLKEGKIIDIGEASAPNIEQFLELSPDAIITSPLNNAPYGRVEKTGVPQIKCIDYMESSPLGRAEWIRFLSLFLGKEVVADSIFDGIETAYNEVKELTGNVEKRPSVLTEMRFGSMWHIPGGQSYVANLFRDAKADYAWYDDKHSGSLGLSFEAVFDKSSEADFWLIKYNRSYDISYEELKKEYAPYTRFAAYKNRHIFVCNTGQVAYYEEIPIRPDYLLKDLVKIFHPDLLPDYEMRYYKKMQ